MDSFTQKTPVSEISLSLVSETIFENVNTNSQTVLDDSKTEVLYINQFSPLSFSRRGDVLVERPNFEYTRQKFFQRSDTSVSDDLYGEFCEEKSDISSGYLFFEEVPKLDLATLEQQSDVIDDINDVDTDISRMEDFKDSFKETLNLFKDIGDLIKRLRSSVNVDNIWIVTLLEDIALLIYGLARSRSLADRLVAITTFTRLRMQKGCFSMLCEQDLLAKANSIFCIEQQGFEEILTDARSYLDKYEEVRECEGFKKIYKLCMYAMSLSIFDKIGLSLESLGYSKIERAAMKKEYFKGPDMIHALCDTLVFLSERGVQCMKMGSLDPIYHSSKGYVEWFDKYKSIQFHYKGNVSSENLEREAQFLRELAEVIEQGDAIFKHARRLGNFERNKIDAYLQELKLIQSEYLSMRFASETRETPFAVLLHGTSKIGKSTLTKMLVYHFAKLFDIEACDDMIYFRNAGADHWDGFKTFKTFIVIDEIAGQKPNFDIDPTVKDIMQLINPAPFTPAQAALEHKGKTPARPLLVVGTTNVKSMNAYHYFSCPSAFQRRLEYIIIPKVKEEYSSANGVLDHFLVNDHEGEYPDWWTFTVKKVIPQTADHMGDLAVEEMILENASLKDFLIWYGDAAIKHRQAQKKVVESSKKMKAIKLCKQCKLPEHLCDCVEQQTYKFWFAFGYIYCMFVSVFHSLYAHYTFFRFCVNSYRRIKGMFSYPEVNSERNFMMNLGNRIHYKIGKYESLIAITTVVGIVFQFYRTFRTTQKFAQQGNQQSVTVEKKPEFERPEKREEERINPWYKDEFVLSSFDVNCKTTSWRSLDEKDVIDRISKNVFKIQVVGSKTTTGMMLNIGGFVYVTNKHTIPEGETLLLSVIRSVHQDGVSANFSFNISSSCIEYVEDSDICYIRITNMPPCKDITDLFANTQITGKFPVSMVIRDAFGSISVKKAPFISLDNRVLMGNKKDKYGVVNFDKMTVAGQCGSPYVMFTPRGPVIVGIHALGSDTGSACIIILKDSLPKCSMIGGGEPNLGCSERTYELQSLHYKSPFKYIEAGVADVYGSLSGFKRTPRSTVCETPMCEHFKSKGFEVKYTSPKMNGYEPWRIAALGMVQPITTITTSDIEKAVSNFKERLVIPDAEKKFIKPLSEFVAVNGDPGVTYIDKINRNTSAGFPFNTSKRKYLNDVEPFDDYSHPVEFNDEIKERVQKLEETYKNGERYMPVYCGHLKDEPVTFAKKAIGKTRVFTGAPIESVIACRKYYLPLVRYIQNNKLMFECAVGTVCQGPEWELLYEFLTKHGDETMIAGDFKMFDKRMPANIILAAFDILIDIAIDSGNYSDDEIEIMRGLAIDTAFAIIDFNGDLISCMGSNPSGHPLTVIINGLVNSLYVRIAFNKVVSNKNFNDCVNFLEYGDDNCMGVSKDCPEFTHTSLQKALGELGIEYTMADKEAESIPYIHINDVSFLKRKWVRCEKYGIMLCPLEWESIEKMLTVWTASKSIDYREQAIAVFTSALMECSFYGEEKYNQMLGWILEFIDEHPGYKPWFNGFPTFLQCLRNFDIQDEEFDEEYTQQSGNILDYAYLLHPQYPSFQLIDNTLAIIARDIENFEAFPSIREYFRIRRVIKNNDTILKSIERVQRPEDYNFIRLFRLRHNLYRARLKRVAGQSATRLILR